jgi:hypothetical protein
MALLGAAVSAQTPDTQTAAFCPPPNAKVEPPIVVLDDVCLAQPNNSYRLQEQAPPLSFRQKADYFKSNKLVSPSAIFGAAFFGEIAQIRKEPPEWNKGAEGFGKRFGTRYTQSLTKSTAEFLFGFLEDPRPKPPPQTYAPGKDGIWRPLKDGHNHSTANNSFGGRLGKALLSVVWTHYDSGRDFIAFSRIGGAFSSGIVGRAWTPDAQNTWGQVGVRTGTAFAGYAGGAVFHEFQPDITKLLGKLTGQSKTPPVQGKTP